MHSGRVLLISAILLLAVFDAAGSRDFSSIYFAPETRVSFKVVASGGEIHRFDRDDPSAQWRLLSADGWKAEFGEGGHVTVTSPDFGHGDTVFEFDRGRIIRMSSAGKMEVFPYEAPRAAPEGIVSPLAFYEFTDEYRKEVETRSLEGKWDGSERLSFPYANPNQSGAFFCLIALAAFAGFASFGKKSRIACGVVAIASAACVVLTGSRGAMIGLAAGVLPFAIFRFRRAFRSRRVWIAAGVVLIAMAGWFAFARTGQLSRGFSGGGLDWGNAVRLDMLRIAPKMMVDAPGGWGAIGAGRAYFDWYQPVNGMNMTGSLMNDHLTILADLGWFGRLMYLFSLFLSLSLAWSLAWRKRAFLPAALLTATTIMACFNPLAERTSLAIVPVCVAMCVIANAVLKYDRIKAILSVGSLAAAAVAAILLFAVGKSSGDETGTRIHVTGRQIRIGGNRPQIWVVDDSQGAIGGIFACRDIREFYGALPHAPGIGYVRSIEDIPSESMKRLVLAGKAGYDWLLRLSENPEARKNLPKEVVFVSPPFSPVEIPSALLHFCKTRVIVGEFAARFEQDYAKPLPIVEIVPGMERYILRWMEYVMRP